MSVVNQERRQDNDKIALRLTETIWPDQFGVGLTRSSGYLWHRPQFQRHHIQPRSAIELAIVALLKNTIIDMLPDPIVQILHEIWVVLANGKAYEIAEERRVPKWSRQFVAVIQFPECRPRFITKYSVHPPSK